MQFATLLVAASALVASVSAGHGNGTVFFTTDVVTAFTTVCPASTQLTYNGVTYTATESTTLTITNCPCTLVKPVTTYSSVSTPAPVYTNATVTHSAPAGTGAPSAPPVPYTAGGNKAFVASGAGLAGLLGLAAYIL